MKRSALRICVILIFGLLQMTASIAFASEKQSLISVTVTLGSYEITSSERGHDIFVDNFGRLLIPGKPSLPSKIFAIAIPPNTEVDQISFDAGEGIVLPGRYEIPPAPLPRVIGQENALIYEKERQRYEENYNSVYGSDNAYPQDIVDFVRYSRLQKIQFGGC